MDKEFIILDMIDKENTITQRQLSEKTGLSLGSVNILINKMIKEGLIKIEKIPADRVLYMLTPKGMLEKMNKTYNYIKIHYSYINSTKEKIKNLLSAKLQQSTQIIAVLREDDELGMLVEMAVKELNNKSIILIDDISELGDINSFILFVLNNERKASIDSSVNNMINILEAI